MSHESYNSYRGYVPHMEFGLVVWYKSTKWADQGTQPAGVRTSKGKAPKDIRRIVTDTADMTEAEKRLDAALMKRIEPKEDLSGNHRMDF